MSCTGGTQTSAALRLGVHITLYTVNWESDITRAPLSFQINQTWTAFPPYVLLCTAKPQSKMPKNRNKEQLHLHLKNFQSDVEQQGVGEVSAQFPERSTSPGSSGPKFYLQSIIRSRYQAPQLKELALQRSSWKEKQAPETKALQQQEC